jgi:SAM-dependent methyltransferase
MDLDTFHELLTPAGQAALADAAALAPTEPAFLAAFEKLRKSYPAPLAKAALETVLLRAKALAKFAAAERMYFTREALEQASSETVARYRAVRFAPFGVVADLCCGIGGDTLGLAAAGPTVHAVESDPLRAAMTKANAAALGLADRIRVHEADALTVALPDVRAAFADPSRRAGGNRHLDPDDYTPPLSALRRRSPRDFPLGVKIAPGVAWNDIADLGAEAEFVSVGGELKDCVLWFGPLRTAGRRATLLPAGLTLFSDEPPPLASISPIGEYVFDPDPAVVRAGLAGLLAGRLGVRPADYTVALFTGSQPIRSPFVTAYRVEWAQHYHPRRLNEYLRQRHVGRVTPVQLGSRIDPREVVKRLKLAGPEHRFVILTQAAGEQTMIVAERLDESPPVATGGL